MAAGVPKVQDSKPFAQNDSWSEPFAQHGSWSAQSLSPLLKMAAAAPKTPFFCSKLQLQPQSKPLAQNGSSRTKIFDFLTCGPNAFDFSARRPNFSGVAKVRTLCSKMTAGAPKVRTLCPKWQLERQLVKLFDEISLFVKLFDETSILNSRPQPLGSRSPNPLLKMAAGSSPLLKMAAGVPKVQALCSKW